MGFNESWCQPLNRLVLYYQNIVVNGKEKELSVSLIEMEKKVANLDREKSDLAKEHAIELTNKELEYQRSFTEFEKKCQEKVDKMKADYDNKYADLETKYEIKFEENNKDHKEEVSILKAELAQLREMLYKKIEQ